MNNKQRKELESVSALIEQMKISLEDEIVPRVENVQEEEQEKYENATEGLQATANYEKMLEIAECLENVVANLNDVGAVLDNAISDLLDCCT